PSGCGKTTIARLIARFYDVNSGTVSVGGRDVRQWDPAELMAQLSLVFQDVYLFDDTLVANVRIGRPEASDTELEEAARLSGVDEIVARLPLGWETRVGEGGRALSGGERQRVSIARALLKDAPIVLFDEATSALDPENEHRVTAAMDVLRQNASLIVIAHKLDTITAADQIVVLDENGRVVQIGTHSQLFAETGGQYRAFWDARTRAAGWRLV
ncbi:MAG: ATP-binding cassette domain-containing protein, partial [Trueperella pyogenes]|nr:ATP-binding cassette domain-containing protein [Trueperella pyogenes]